MARKTTSYMPTDCKELCAALQSVSSNKAVYQVFEDWLAISAISISSYIDPIHYDEREKEYQRIRSGYTDGEMDKLAKCLNILTNVMTEKITTVGYKDILGEVFHALNLHDKYKGQFFTPSHICEFMGEVSLCNGTNILTDKVGESLYNKGYTSIYEPCIGSGGMVIGFAQAMHNNKLNPQQQLLVTGVDIDIKCVYMSYLQLSLYGIPAVIYHGNSLTNGVWSTWYTPMYVIGGWENKLHINNENLSNSDITYEKNEDGQLMLF